MTNTAVDHSSITIPHPTTSNTAPPATRSIDDALIATRLDIGAVGKNGTYAAPGRSGNGGVRYSYRKHDDLVDACGRAMADNGVNVVMVDIIGLEYDRADRMTKVTAMVKFLITATGTSEQRHVIVAAEAADNSDKSTNKLMTAAQKNMYMQVFHVAVTDTDPDQERPDVETPRAVELARSVNETAKGDDDLSKKVAIIQGAWRATRSMKDVVIPPAACLPALGIEEPIELGNYIAAVGKWIQANPQSTPEPVDTW